MEGPGREYIHGEDGCPGCDGNRGPAGVDWEARLRTITAMEPDIAKWVAREGWTRAVIDTGSPVTHRWQA
ncbi:hypothetical protein SHL15_7537 [Streptomyces hygroscopicus subsp. limoneus]|nr:hypothetical protein SHL15_7537 [Streptomyces hygroscopicus subsp. limoneus]